VARANGLLVTWDRKIRQNPERAKYLGASNVKLWQALQRRMNEASDQEVSVRVNWTFDEAAQVAERILATVLEPMEFRGQEVRVGTSLGIALFPADGLTPGDLIKGADTAMYLAKAAGARRAVPLPVSAPFHCALMKPAQERLAVDLRATQFLDLRVPLINNVAAREVRGGAEARQGLIDQVTSPVQWTESVRRLVAAGVERCIETGAGGVLTGLLRSIAPGVKGVRFGEAGELAAVEGLQ